MEHKLTQFDAVAEVVRQRLQTLEQQHQVKILFAVESGSRAWGFASPNSDWDVRFIYVHKLPWYLRVQAGRDVIESAIEQHELGELDINGWELRKSLQLLRKGNPALLEWLQSPMRYVCDDAAMHAYRELAQRFISPAAGFYHYYCYALKNQRQFLGKDLVKRKKYLYVLRGVLAADWISRGYGQVPIRLSDLLERLLPEGEVRLAIDDLVAQKMQTEELAEQAPLLLLEQYIASELLRLRDLQPATQQCTQDDYRASDALLYQLVQQFTSAKVFDGS